MEWSSQQEQALRAVSDWVKSKSSPQVFRLFGFAGTGKSTLAREIASYVKGPVLYMAFTGKAALVMRKKGCAGASTIHSAIYTPSMDSRTGEVTFKLNADSAVRTARLIIVDEVSMVNAELGQDLLSFGTKVLVLGDPFQLPPVQGDGFFTDCAPDVMLTEIHRQAQDNPILWMAHTVRSGEQLPFGQYGPCSVASRKSVPTGAVDELMRMADQILCGTNKNRVALNQRHRELLGLVHNQEDPFRPSVGDKLVCLRNNRMKGLLNGSLWQIDRVHKKKMFDLQLSSLDETGKKQSVSVWSNFFDGSEATLSWRTRKDSDEFTFGNALTVHRSQGSQWDKVLVFDDSRVFGEHKARHLYTAITRAAEAVVVLV